MGRIWPASTSLPAFDNACSHRCRCRRDNISLSSSDIISFRGCSQILIVFARRAFNYTAPTTWNSLPADILTCDSESGFKRLLKTHLFNNCFNVAWLTHSQRLCSFAYGALQICLWLWLWLWLCLLFHTSTSLVFNAAVDVTQCEVCFDSDTDHD